MPKSDSLFIQQLEIGPMQNFIYLIGNTETKEAFVVDPAWDVDTIREAAAINDLNLIGALISHGHPDHTNGINDLLSTHDIPILVSKYEASFYKPVGDNIKEIDPNQKIKLGHFEIEALHTPGHTPGSQSFMIEGNLFTGDTLFLDGCGRCDMPGGDAEELYHTIYHRLMKLPNSTIIHPGHNYHHLHHDLLENQKESNPYMTCNSKEEFVHQRMG